MRVMDTPLSECGIIGTAIGMALYGLRAVPEIQFLDFIYPAFDQIVTRGGEDALPLRRRVHRARWSIRSPSGGGIRGGHYHSQSSEAYFAHTPGLRVVMPSTPRDAKGLLLASIFQRRPGALPRAEGALPPRQGGGRGGLLHGRRSTRRASSARATDVTVVTWGAMVPICEEAAKLAAEKDISVEVIDLRSIFPWDVEAVLESVRKTGPPRHRAGGAAHLRLRLRGRGDRRARRPSSRSRRPIGRVAGFDTPFPYTLEHVYKPDKKRVLNAIEYVAQLGSSRRARHGVRVQAARHRRGPHRGRGREVAGQGRRRRHGRPADGRGHDRQGHGGDHRAARRHDRRRSARQEGEMVPVGSRDGRDRRRQARAAPRQPRRPPTAEAPAAERRHRPPRPPRPRRRPAGRPPPGPRRGRRRPAAARRGRTVAAGPARASAPSPRPATRKLRPRAGRRPRRRPGHRRPAAASRARTSSASRRGGAAAAAAAARRPRRGAPPARRCPRARPRPRSAVAGRGRASSRCAACAARSPSRWCARSSSSPHFTYVDECDMTEVATLREQAKAVRRRARRQAHLPAVHHQGARRGAEEVPRRQRARGRRERARTSSAASTTSASRRTPRRA